MACVKDLHFCDTLSSPVLQCQTGPPSIYEDRTVLQRVAGHLHYTPTHRTVAVTVMKTVGSEVWLGVSEYDPEGDLHKRATQFVGAIKWEALISLASKARGMTCELSAKNSLGHFNLVRRIVFQDGVSWLARLRLPELQSFFGTLPEIFAYDLAADNAVGAPYILMSYIHGSTAAELAAARNCEEGVFGEPEQDERFWQQMASIHVELASLTFDKIGSLIHREDQDQFSIGPEIETGKGPWNTPLQYYSAVANHRMQVGERDGSPELNQSDSFTLPRKFLDVIEAYSSSPSGSYGLANRDFGAHNVLVNTEFSVVGLIDFDGVLAAPSEVVAQFPSFMGLKRPVPGHVETRELALKRIAATAHLIPKYVKLVQAAIAKLEEETGKQDTSGLAELLDSDAASAVQGLDANSQLQLWLNDRWMPAYDRLLQKKSEAEVVSNEE